MQTIDITYVEIIRHIQNSRAQKTPLPDAARIALVILFDSLKMDVRFCRLEWCQIPFVPKKADQLYCQQEHKYEDWNKNRRESSS